MRRAGALPAVVRGSDLSNSAIEAASEEFFLIVNCKDLAGGEGALWLREDHSCPIVIQWGVADGL